MTSRVPAVETERRRADGIVAVRAGTRASWAERLADCSVGLLAALVEAMGVVWLIRAEALSLLAVLALHAAVAAALWGWLRWRAGRARDASVPQLLLLVTLATGPIGCALMALAALRPVAPAAETRLLTQWYERIALASGTDPVTDLAEGVATGRTIDLGRPVTTSFDAIMRGADTRAQQAVLGLIARTFRPEYTPALALALKSDEPVIRVQAAAVATRIKPELAGLAGAARALVDDPAASLSSRLTARRHLDLAIRSGLLEVADRAEAVHVAAELDRVLADATGPIAAGGADRTVRRVLALAPPARLEIEERLIALGRFHDLRRLRRLMRLAAGRLYRVRAMPRPARSTDLTVVIR